jgi:drug/metabolite transporter (DMT)-like permease
LPSFLAQLAGAAFVGVFTPTVPVYVAILSAILRIERFTLLKVCPSAG